MRAAPRKNNKCWLGSIRAGTDGMDTATLALCLTSYSSIQGLPREYHFKVDFSFLAGVDFMFTPKPIAVCIAF